MAARVGALLAVDPGDVTKEVAEEVYVVDEVDQLQVGIVHGSQGRAGQRVAGGWWRRLGRGELTMGPPAAASARQAVGGAK